MARKPYKRSAEGEVRRVEGLRSINSRKKMSLSKKGKIPKNFEEMRRKGWESNKKKQKGSKNVNWKGGITPLYHKIYNSFEYRLWRSDVFKRDWFTCQDCGLVGKNLRPHHIKTVKEIIEEYKIKTFEEALECAELWDINNGMTLCQRCHRKYHN